MARNSPGKLGWQALGSICPYLSTLEFVGIMPGLSRAFWGLNLGPYVCEASLSLDCLQLHCEVMRRIQGL